jgi:lipid-A-disaccharide synthase
MTTPAHIALVAGETSGDLLGGLLLGGLKNRWPNVALSGIGGPQMAAQGFEAWWPHDKLAVSGYVDVLRRYNEISSIRKQLAQRLLQNRPDAFIGIDAPDFNLGLETTLKTQGIKAIHFVSPSIWAWRGKRIEKIRRATDLVLCLFPFEPALYAQHDINAAFVGHPLADVIPLDVPCEAARKALALPANDVVVALLPGSRRAEMQYIAPRLLAAAAEMSRQRPHLRFLLPVAPGLRELLEPLRQQHAAHIHLTVLDGQSHPALAACDLTLVASGTATLEAALFKRPMVIAYVMHPINWQIMKRLKYQPWVGLPNILLNDFCVPEFLQADASANNLAQAGLDWLDNPARCLKLQQRFHDLHLQLRRNTAAAAAHAIEKVLQS